MVWNRFLGAWKYLARLDFGIILDKESKDFGIPRHSWKIIAKLLGSSGLPRMQEIPPSSFIKEKTYFA